MTFDETAITFCSYCGSQAMLESRMMKQNNPDFIIPFKKTKEECIAAYKNRVSSFLFAPSYMKSDVVVEKFRGIFIPYGVYNLAYTGKVANYGSKYSHRYGDYQYYDDYTISAFVDASYNGISFDLVSKYYDRFSHSIPFNFKEKVPFNPNYLVGFYADTKDVDSIVYDNDAKTITKVDSCNRLLGIKEFLRYGCKSPSINCYIKDHKVGMFPVYFLAIRDKSNKYVNYAIVNGQTGEIAVDMPIDFKKYLVASFIIGVLIFLVLMNFLTLTPKNVIIISLIFSIISLFISISQSNKLSKREEHRDDLGYMSLEENKNKVKKNKSYFKYLYKEILGIVISILVLLINFVNDIYYYASAIIALVLVVLSFKDLIEEYNLLVYTKLPQLEKRGGD
jgi:hypothetical protein